MAETALKSMGMTDDERSYRGAGPETTCFNKSQLCVEAFYHVHTIYDSICTHLRTGGVLSPFHRLGNYGSEN